MPSPLEEFRQQVYDLLPRQRDAVMDLIDALASNTTADTVVELSLSPWFRRQWNGVFDAIEAVVAETDPCAAARERERLQGDVARVLAPHLPAPHQDRFWLWGVDVTPWARPYADTLADRSFVYQATPVPGQKPVTVGHAYSQLALLPPRQQGEPPWALPLRIDRVASAQSKPEVGVRQLLDLLHEEDLPFAAALNVLVADSDYPKVPVLGLLVDQPQLVGVFRVAGNRVFYRLPAPADQPRPAHHPTWYGEAFDLKDPDTWGPPDEEVRLPFTTCQGRALTLHLQGWDGLLMRSTRAVPMHRHPFTLIRVQLLDETGPPVYRKALWLIVLGARRRELSVVDATQAYRQRYDLEHYFRFAKQKLLATAFQTNHLEHEHNWWLLVQLAAQHLWLARRLVTDLPRPWERVRAAPGAVVSPARVQRAFGALVRQIGTPAAPPQPRGNSPGRPPGTSRPPRPRLPLLRKGKRRRKKAA